VSSPLGRFAVSLAATAISCSTPFIEQRPLVVGAEAADAAPALAVALDGAAVPETEPSGILFRGKLSYSDYTAGDALEAGNGNERAALTLELTAEDPLRTLTLHLGVAPELVPAMERGARYAIRVYLDPGDPFTPAALGLVVRSESGQLVYLLSTNDAVPDSESPAGIHVAASEKPAFYTTTISRSGCTISEVHRFVDIESQGRTAHVSPGESREFRGVSGRFVLFVLDNSTSSSPEECAAESLPHFSYVVVPAARPR